MSQNQKPKARVQAVAPDGRIVVGIIATIMSAFMLTSMDAIVFNLRPYYGVLETQMVRNCAGMLMLFTLVLLRREPLLPRYQGFWLTVFRGVTIVPIGFLFFSSFKLLDQGSATALVYTYPLVLTALAAIFLREKTGVWRWGAVVLGFVGVVSVQVALWMAQGETWMADTSRPLWLTIIYSLLPVSAAIIFAVNVLAVRFIAKGISALTITYVGAIASLATIIPIWLMFGEKIPIDWAAHGWQIALLGLLSISASQALTIAFRAAPAAVVGSLEYVGIIFATGLAWFTQSMIPPAGIWFGVALIVGAGILTAWREARHKAKSESES